MKTEAKVAESIDSGKELSEYFRTRLSQFLEPLLITLDALLDKRLVETLYQSVACMIRHRNRSHGLLLTELGSFLAGARHAPAGTKRLSNLLRSQKWDYTEIQNFIFGKAMLLAQELRQKSPLLVMYDESVVEKPESFHAEGLCAVPSSKSKRLTRIKPGYYLPPLKGVVHVPGFQWTCALLSTLGTAPQLLQMEWWTTRGDWASHGLQEKLGLFSKIAQHLPNAIHIFDRGYSGQPWLKVLFEHQAEFILRWNTTFLLADLKGNSQHAWRLVAGKKMMASKYLWDTQRKQRRNVGMLYVEIRHPKFPNKRLWLVISKHSKGHAPWYLITNKPILSNKDAWFIIHAYSKRWEIEQTFRTCKTELALESPRLKFWHNRMKIMHMVSLVYAFLLALIHITPDSMRNILLNVWCKRTGKRYSLSKVPLYRLRLALANLWNYRMSQNSG